MSNIINLTAADVVIKDSVGRVVQVFKPSAVARAQCTDYLIDEIEFGGKKVQIIECDYWGVSGLPDPTEGFWLIVNTECVVAAFSCGRTVDDLIVPVDPIFLENGQICAYRRFVRFNANALLEIELQSAKPA